MAADRAPDGVRALKAFGWHGINLTVPSTWDLAYTQGTRESGSVNLTDEESVRLEVHWLTERKASSPGATVGAFLAKLAKKARKDRVQLDVQRNLSLASPPGMDVECYRWTGDRQVLAMLSRCRTCGRRVHLQMHGARGEQLKRLARTVFSSLRDHPEAGTDLWSVYDVRLRTPVALHLTGSSLQSGCIRLTFGKGRSRLEFVRVSLAEVLLARQGLAEWFRHFHGRRLRRRRFTLEDAAVHGHAGLRATGRRWALLDPGRLFGGGRVLRAACWHCDATNRLFLCAFDGRRRDVDWFEPAVAGFFCCGEEEGG
jgi:hypothetical protein